MKQCDYFTAIRNCSNNSLVHNYAREVIEPVRDDSLGTFTITFKKRFSAQGWIVDSTDSVAAKQMVMKADLFPKSESKDGVKGNLIERYVGGPNIVFLNGPDWKRYRKIATPAFHRALPVRVFGNLAQTMFKVIDEDPVDVTNLST